MRTCVVTFLLLLAAVKVIGQDERIEVVFSYGRYGKDKLDSAAGTFTKDMVCDPSVTVVLMLSQTERQRILKMAEAVGFFEMPERLQPDDATYRSYALPDPNNEYSLEIVASGERRVVRWNDAILKPWPERERAELLVKFIQLIVFSKREYREMPQQRCYYGHI